MDTHQEDMQNIDDLKAQLEHYRGLILVNEQTNQQKERELESMQEAIASGVRQLEDKNVELSDKLRRYELDAEEKDYRLESLEQRLQRQEQAEAELREAQVARMKAETDLEGVRAEMLRDRGDFQHKLDQIRQEVEVKERRELN